MLSPAERYEWLHQAEVFAANRSDIEREIALNNVNALLDKYLKTEVEYVGYPEYED